MRRLELIRAQFRLSFSPSARPLLIGLLVFSLVLPIVTMLLVPPSETTLPLVSMAIVSNEADNDVLQTVVSEFGKIDLIKSVSLFSNEQEAAAELERGNILLYMAFPQNFFIDSLAALKRDTVKIVLHPDMPVEGEFFARMTDQITISVVDVAAAYYAYADLIQPYYTSETALNRHLDATIFGLLLRLLARNRLVTSQDAPKFDLVAFAFASILVVLVLFAGLLPMFFAKRDDQLGLTARFQASGFHLFTIQISRLITGLPYAGIALLPLLLIMNLSLGYPLTPTLLCNLVLLYLVQGTLALALTALSKDATTPVLVTFGITLLHMLLGGTIYPQELLPKALRGLVAFVPAGIVHENAFASATAYEAQSGTVYLAITLALLFTILWMSVRHQQGRRV